jgi:hypothetical protein
LVERSGAGIGSSDAMQRQTDLWLWPLPDGNTLSLLLQWTSLGVPLIRHRIEMHSVRAAAQREMRYWP